MQHNLLSYLRCPCGGKLRMISFDPAGIESSVPSETNGRNNQSQCSAQERRERETAEGVLVCDCRAIYPIINGVPRIIEDNQRIFADFYAKHQPRLVQLIGDQGQTERTIQDQRHDHSIRQSFSAEWAFYDYERDNTWGWNLAQRKQVFLDDINMEASHLSGKTLLDGGCGNGTLTAALSSFDMEVVGLDISDGVAQAEHNKGRIAGHRAEHVHFVHGSLSAPPLEKNRFDIIHSSGVLHHTPDTHETFLKIIPLLKPGGRIYIWVYKKRSWIRHLWTGHGRFIRDHVSLKTLFHYCQAIAPLYKVTTDLLSLFRISSFRKRTVHEITLDLFDCFSPKFNHTHTEDEVVGWFRQAGLINVTVSGRQKHGFGVYGDKL